MRYAFPLALAAALILGACAPTTPTASSLDELSTSVALTLESRSSATKAPASATATPLPSDTPEPTATATSTPAPTAANLPAATEIAFATGATENTVSGSLQAGATRYYRAGAAEGQIMMVGFPFPEDELALSVFGADGSLLLAEESGEFSWRGALPSSQYYYFGLHAASQQDYTLNLTIAAPIEFAPGEDELLLSGQTVDGLPTTYSAYAFEDQALELHLDSAGEVGLTVYGFSDGQPYARAQNGVTDFELTLPGTQYYIIKVVPQGGQELDYQLSIEID